MIYNRVLNYKIEAKLGEGGMGTVYLATHALIDRKAAIKALHPSLVNNPMIRERFKNEAFAMAQLKHPNIVDLYDYYEDNNGLYLIMEYVEGFTLDEYIQKISGAITEEKCINLFIKILDGFQYAHQKGIIHRDIKPSNLIITPKLDIKILDFGIARLLSADKGKTQAGTKMGTVLYMSPEQVRGEEADNRSDIYSLGVTLFEMLTGKPLYGDQLTEYEVNQKILNEPLPRLNSIYPNISVEIQAIVDKATNKNPINRFQHCEEFKNALQFLQARYAPKPELKVEKPAPKKNKGKNSASVFILLFLILISSIVVLFNPFDFSIFKDYALFEYYVRPSKKETKKETPEEELRNFAFDRINAFYQVLETRKMEFIKPFFRDSVENYFGYKKINFSPDVRASLRIDWQKNSDEKFEIIEDSFFVKEDSLQNRFVSYQYHYTFKTKKTNLVTVVKKAEVKLDKNWKIFYMDSPKK